MPPKKFNLHYRSNVFESLLCSSRLHLFDQKSCKTVLLLQFKIIESILKAIYFCDVKAVFLALLLQSSVSHDPSEIHMNICGSRNISNYHRIELLLHKQADIYGLMN